MSKETVLIYIKIFLYFITELLENVRFRQWFSKFKLINDFPALRRVIICWLLSDVTCMDLINYAFTHPWIFSFFVLLLAVSTVLVGILESHFTFKRYMKVTGEKNLSKEDSYRIKKFGSSNPLYSFKGVYDTDINFIKYAAMCNLYGSFFIIGFVIFLKFQEGYLEYFQQLNDNNDVFFIAVQDFIAYICMLICLIQISELQNKPTLKPSQITNNPYLENPDNYRSSHFHVLFNMLHFWFTVFMVICLALTFFAFIAHSFVSRYNLNLHYLIIIPIIMALAFMVHSSHSYYANKIGAVSKGASLPMVAIGGVVVLIILLFFKKTVMSVSIFGIYFLFAGSIYKLGRSNRSNAVTWIPILGVFGLLFIWLLHLLYASFG